MIGHGQKECAIVGCQQTASDPPVVVELITVAAVEVPLCGLCRQPFEHAVASLFDLVFDLAAVA